MKRTAEMALATGLSIVGLTACGTQTNNHQEKRSEAPSQAARKVGRASLNGCDLPKARSQLNRDIKDGQRFGADIFSHDGQPLPVAVEVTGKKAVVDPIILECGSRAVAIAGLDDAMKAESDKDYDPVRLYAIRRSVSNTPLPRGMDISSSTMRFMPAKEPKLKKGSGFSLVAVMQGFEGTDHLSFAFVAPMNDARGIVRLMETELQSGTQTSALTPSAES